MSRSVPRAVLALTVAVLAVVALVTGTAAAGPFAKPGLAAASAALTSTPVLTGIRTGRHTGFDRVVLDFSGHVPTVRSEPVEYLTADGSGDEVFLNGEFFTSVVVNPAAAHDESGASTYGGPRTFRTPALRNVMAVTITGDYEAYLSIGIGTRTRTPVTVSTLASPTRVVIDIRH